MAEKKQPPKKSQRNQEPWSLEKAKQSQAKETSFDLDPPKFRMPKERGRRAK